MGRRQFLRRDEVYDPGSLIHAVHLFIKGIDKAVSAQQSDTCALNSVRVCVSSWPLRVVQSVQPEELRHSRVCFAVCPLAMCLSDFGKNHHGKLWESLPSSSE